MSLTPLKTTSNFQSMNPVQKTAPLYKADSEWNRFFILEVMTLLPLYVFCPYSHRYERHAKNRLKDLLNQQRYNNNAEHFNVINWERILISRLYRHRVWSAWDIGTKGSIASKLPRPWASIYEWLEKGRKSFLLASLAQKSIEFKFKNNVGVFSWGWAKYADGPDYVGYQRSWSSWFFMTLLKAMTSRFTSDLAIRFFLLIRHQKKHSLHSRVGS